MKKIYTLFLLLLVVVSNSFAQVNTTPTTWTPIGNVIISTVNDDADNGDGVGDGAILATGQVNAVGQGAAYTFGGTMQTGQSINISTFTYNRNSSFVSFVVQLYNVTTSKVLATSATITINGINAVPTPSPVNTIVSYTAKAADNGQVLQVRYVRNDNGDKVRAFAIDNLFLTGPCPFTVTPDLPLLTSNPTIDAEITGAVKKFSDSYLGTSIPSATALNNAVTAYNTLGITVTGGVISGNPTANFGVPTFLKTFAQYLKANPANTDPRDIQSMANKTVWWVSKQFCDGTLAIDDQTYSYQTFARPTILLQNFLDPIVKNLFANTLYQHTRQFQHYWSPTYDSAYQQVNGVINTDQVYNLGDVLLAYTLWQNSADERYRYMTAFQRYMNRFFSYTVGTSDGLKPDGNGFHHNAAYNNYMYAYSSAAVILSYLDGTNFQVGQANYKVFRNAFYTQFIQSNDAGVQPFSTAGRNPQSRTRPLALSALKTLAIVGGKILGLTTADPILAGMYNRINGSVDSAFNYSTISPFPEGFFQFNHAMAGAFRKGNIVVFNKGFSNNMFGSEIYTNQNRYGRYQSYGAQEVIYPGDKLTGNGYDDKTWDWNFNPGTTVIKLPWAKLHAEWSRLDELQQKRFVGTLSFSNKNSEVLTNNHGSYGLFAMDFQEDINQGFGTNYSGNAKNHNSSFAFKKSNFYFDDIIVCLGSGITNNDTSNETITTLFQRLDNKGIGVNVNGANQTSGIINYVGTSNNWLLSNYGTGFYLVSGNDNLIVKKETQQNPNQDQTWPVDFSGNTSATYYTGYINHGTNPSNKNYEYIVKPNSNTTEMVALDSNIQSANKPYNVLQQDANAHIVQHIAKNIWGYAIFKSTPTTFTYDYVTEVSGSCLVMTQYDNVNSTLLVSIDNPDIGFVNNSFSPSIPVTRQVTLKGEWLLNNSYPGVQILSSDATKTVIQFTLVDGLAKEVLLTSALLSTQDFEKSPITIYPNPAKNVVTIQGLEENIVTKASIISMLGQIIKTVELSGNQIDISNVEEGIYFIKLQMADRSVVTKKLIIKR